MREYMKYWFKMNKLGVNCYKLQLNPYLRIFYLKDDTALTYVFVSEPVNIYTD